MKIFKHLQAMFYWLEDFMTSEKFGFNY